MIIGEGITDIIPFVDTIVSAYPQHAATVLEKCGQTVVAETAGIAGAVLVMSEAAGLRQPLVEAGIGGNPDCALVVLIDITDAIAVQAPGIVRIMLVMCKSSRGGIELIESCLIGTNPELTVLVLKYRPHPVLAETIGDSRIMTETDKLTGTTVHPRQPAAIGTYP